MTSRGNALIAALAFLALGVADDVRAAGPEDERDDSYDIVKQTLDAQRERVEALVEPIELRERGAYAPINCRRRKNRDTTYCTYWWNGHTMWRDKRYVRAARYFAAALEERPTSQNAIADLGSILTILDYCDLAIPFLRRGAHIEHDSFALYRLARCYDNIGYTGPAAERAVHAANLERNSAWTRQELISYYIDVEQWQSAVGLVDELVEEGDFNDDGVLTVLSYFLPRTGRPDRGIEILEAATAHAFDEGELDDQLWVADEWVTTVFKFRPESLEEVAAKLDDYGAKPAVLRARVSIALRDEGSEAARKILEEGRKKLEVPSSKDARSMQRFREGLVGMANDVREACLREVLRSGDTADFAVCRSKDDVTHAESATLASFNNDVSALERITRSAHGGGSKSLAAKIDQELRYRKFECGSVNEDVLRWIRTGSLGHRVFEWSLATTHQHRRCDQKVSTTTAIRRHEARMTLLYNLAHATGVHLEWSDWDKAHETTAALKPGDPPHFYVARMWSAAGVGDRTALDEARAIARSSHNWRHRWDLAEVYFHVRRKDWKKARLAFDKWLEGPWQPPAFSQDQSFAVLILRETHEERPDFATYLFDRLMMADTPRSRGWRRLLSRTDTKLAGVWR